MTIFALDPYVRRSINQHGALGLYLAWSPRYWSIKLLAGRHHASLTINPLPVAWRLARKRAAAAKKLARENNARR